MAAPNLIELHTGPSGFDSTPFDTLGWNDSLGPFEHGAFRYFVYARRGGATPYPLAVARTSDGVTFTVLDTAHAPSLATGFSKVGAVAVVGSVLWIAYHDVGDTLNLVSFDMGANLYGTVFVGPSPAKPFDVFQLVALSGGGFVVTLGVNAFLAGGFYFVTVTSGGVFGALTAIAIFNANYPNGGVLSAVGDIANGVHGLYSSEPVVNFELHYFRIAGGVVVADSILSSGPNICAQDTSPNGVGKYFAASDTIAFPILDVNSAQLLNVVFVAHASTAPAVTIEAVAAGNLALLNSPAILLDKAGAVFIFAYLSYDAIVATKEQVRTYTRPVSGGAWTAGPVFWDSAVSAPVPAPSFISQLAPMNLTLLSSGLYGTVLGFGFSAGSANVLYYLEAALPLVVPAVIIKGGGVSSFYFWGVLRFPLLSSGDEPAPYNPDISRAPRIAGTENQNIMAPEWMLGNQCTPETPDGYWDEPFTLFSPAVVNAVGATTVGVFVDVPKDCETFLVRNVQYNSVLGAGVSGAATVQIRLPSGYSLTNRDMLPADWTGPLFTVLAIPGGGRIILDVGDMDAAGAGSITTTVQFDGVKRRKL